MSAAAAQPDQGLLLPGIPFIHPKTKIMKTKTPLSLIETLTAERVAAAQEISRLQADIPAAEAGAALAAAELQAHKDLMRHKHFGRSGVLEGAEVVDARHALEGADQAARGSLDAVRFQLGVLSKRLRELDETLDAPLHLVSAREALAHANHQLTERTAQEDANASAIERLSGRVSELRLILDVEHKAAAATLAEGGTFAANAILSALQAELNVTEAAHQICLGKVSELKESREQDLNQRAEARRLFLIRRARAEELEAQKMLHENQPLLAVLARAAASAAAVPLGKQEHEFVVALPDGMWQQASEALQAEAP